MSKLCFASAHVLEQNQFLDQLALATLQLILTLISINVIYAQYLIRSVQPALITLHLITEIAALVTQVIH